LVTEIGLPFTKKFNVLSHSSGRDEEASTGPDGGKKDEGIGTPATAVDEATSEGAGKSTGPPFCRSGATFTCTPQHTTAR
jgi:hypothetical protein